MINRRQFMVGLSVLGVIGAVTSLKKGAFSTTDSSQSSDTNSALRQPSWLVSAGSDNKGQYFVAAFTVGGTLISKVNLSARGHDVLAIKSKPGHALVFARRPGTFVLEVDFSRGEIVQQIEVSHQQHFYGHGALINNDNILLTTENNYLQGKGLIVLRDRHTQKVIEKYDSGGIGPHEIAIMPDIGSATDSRIVIANGGIKTHPMRGRKKLNLSTMEPNLAYMELSSGKIIDKYRLENKKLSIRHLDVSQQGKVIAGLQYQGASTDQVPLAISHQGESQLQFLKASSDVWQSMKQYTASVCINEVNNSVAITCPKANLLTHWQLSSGEFIASYKLKDSAGLALINNAMFASTGRGKIAQQTNPRTDYEVMADFADYRWDNHMTAITDS